MGDSIVAYEQLKPVIPSYASIIEALFCIRIENLVDSFLRSPNQTAHKGFKAHQGPPTAFQEPTTCLYITRTLIAQKSLIRLRKSKTASSWLPKHC
jgi:hypothetical protein